VRVVERGGKKFDIGARMIKVMKDDMDKVIRHALMTSAKG
jgi:hypothetical protein